jgi:hypothetical protein
MPGGAPGGGGEGEALSSLIEMVLIFGHNFLGRFLNVAS